ncbi:cbb3-type cytochrome c oxidase N-terminal domain-containing protein [Urechidicola vernalis]|uniref:Cbb3-type cytochrome c oxidase N-terminal domain-containing protein n=1 Tax=Urechidicola vernalis TaxID=3075600 RepID=A0ABU2Y3W8_9FLAO|nr:cbb3-type cytochrome c oxidase N-terminal domain-containing protein [Urechidicola sp. P050]MDT0552892.1 cbb3-type cytochrome c oxidase N-terminal domain-containing protein [Urechidicola sp. P050]
MKGYLKTTVFAIIIFGVLWYFIGTKAALDFVKEPELVFGLVILLIVILINSKVRKNLRQVRFDKLSDEEKALETTAQANWYKNLMQKLTATKPIEEEQDILMDHAYDGIRELDNDLPPWWLYGFYATIVFAFVYIGYYHMFDGDDQTAEFNKEMAQAEADIAEYKKNAKGLIDASTVEVMTEQSDLDAGKSIYEANCMVCHLADGGGSIGPNFTDDNWILGGGIKNVFTTVSEGGRDGKGMIAWKSMLSPEQIAQVSSYVLSFQGTTPAAGKAPEGDVWSED